MYSKQNNDVVEASKQSSKPPTQTHITTSSSQARPFTITMIMILLIIDGLIFIMWGSCLLAVSVGTGVGILLGVVIFIFSLSAGLFSFIVAFGIKTRAPWTYTILVSFIIVSTIFAIFSLNVFGIVFSIIIAYYSTRSNIKIELVKTAYIKK